MVTNDREFSERKGEMAREKVLLSESLQFVVGCTSFDVFTPPDGHQSVTIIEVRFRSIG